MMRVVLFFVLRYQWALALWLVTALVKIRAPSWLVNGAGMICGTGWACAAMRLTGWHPQMVVQWYDRQREVGHGSL